jgi:ketosteroid isomerase-like protein
MGGHASASENSDVVAHVRQVVSDVNKGDAAAIGRDFVEAPQIIDNFPPFAWSGANALAEWDQAYKLDAARRSIVKATMTLQAATHVDVRDGKAYVVVPARCDFTRKDKRPSHETGRLTFALTKSAQGPDQKSDPAWRVLSVAWTGD